MQEKFIKLEPIEIDKELDNKLRYYSKHIGLKPGTISKFISKCLSYKACEYEYDSIIKHYNNPLKKQKAITKEKCIYLYGNHYGNLKWNEYIERQAYTNSYEYKKKKYGMTKEDFDDFNKSRAVTLENLMNKHGIEKGTSMWNEYIERQRYAGNTIEYFVEKYGKEKGELEYKRVCSEKAITYDNMMRIYNNHDIAVKKVESNHSRVKYRSKSADNCINSIVERYLNEEERNLGYFEYTVYSKKNNRVYKYDYVNTKLKLCIEFNGDDWHGNPLFYKENDIPIKFVGKSAKELWECDKIKKEVILLERNVLYYYTIWEHDYHNNFESIMKSIGEVINECRANI